ncbi:hypothetical protein R3P38DRAFT_1925921 [Favolaschia claudopus]|uniref:Uncharacterized protein n=1 Tax=Favolaschia claudopus TaxID=2862362 RepID=A0AAW0A1J9_9AGAR
MQSSVMDADSPDTEFDAQWKIAIPIFYETVELVFYSTHLPLLDEATGHLQIHNFTVIFLAMFFLAAYLFHNNRARSGVRILLYLTSAMFVLGTIQMTLKMVIRRLGAAFGETSCERRLDRANLVHSRTSCVFSVHFLNHEQCINGRSFRTLPATLLCLQLHRST